MKSAVITGPTGSIGTALIEHLISNGIEVLAIVRPDSKRTDNIPTLEIQEITCKDNSRIYNIHWMR